MKYRIYAALPNKATGSKFLDSLRVEATLTVIGQRKFTKHAKKPVFRRSNDVLHLAKREKFWKAICSNIRLVKPFRCINISRNEKYEHDRARRRSRI